jgi:outer membrane protein TolC
MMKKISSVLLCSLAAVSLATPLRAQSSSDAPPADRARLDEIARQAAKDFATAKAAGATDTQTQPTNPVPQGGQVIELTLDDAVERALDRNLELAVERLNPQTFDLSLARIRAVYRPTLTSVFGQQSRINPPSSTLNGGNIVDNDTTTYNMGITQSVPWAGANFTFNFNNNKQVSSNLFSNYNPAFNSNFSLNYTQPILRDLSIDNTRQQLRVTAINRDISETQLRGIVATTLANVRNAYWELLYAIQAVDVARGSLDLADKLVQDNKARVEVGTMAPLDVVQAEAEAATRRQAVTTAEAAQRTAELTLKRLIVNGTDDPLWRAQITPVDRVTFRSEAIDVEAAVRKALSDRSDIEVARKTVASNDVTLKYSHNQTLPTLDAVLQYGAVGLGGLQAIRTGSGGINSSITGYLPGGYGDAWRTLTGNDYPNWNVSLNFSYPIGQSAQEASYARARIQRNQAAAQLRALELSIATEVTNAALQVESNLKRYEAATAARELAETRLSAEQSRFEVGLSTNFFVVQAQRDLATQQISELRALLDYRRSLVDFERVQQSPAQGRGTQITTVSGN